MKTTTRIPFAIRCGTAAVLVLASAGAMATEYGRVVSSVPVRAQVPVPQTMCTDEQQLVQTPTSGAGALLGALIGGAVGNSMGAGMGRAAATGIGVVAGAAIGNNVETNGRPVSSVPVRRCQTGTRYESRVVGYDVTYEYRGEHYTTRLNRDPGRRIALDVNVAPQDAEPMESAEPPQAYAQPPQGYLQPPQGYVQPPQVVYASPAYVAPPPVVSVPYGYVAPTVVIGAGYWGHRHHGHWH